MSNAKAVSIVVLNYNGLQHLAALLKHLAQQTVREFELIFVDNGSHDNSVAFVEQTTREYGLDLQLIRNERNLGFAPACNQGIQVANSDWVVMLNNDTRPEPTWLEHLLATPQAGAKVGMVASKMLSAAKPTQIDSAGIALDWMGIAWDWRGGEQDDPQEQQLQEIFGPCGGAALYAKQLLLDLGGFDADFFAYLEDVDLAWRARLAGWRCLFQPQARVLHAHSATLGDQSPFKRFLLGRNKVWLLAKNYPNPWFRRYLPLIMGYDLMAVTYGAARRRDWASLQGRLAGLRGLPAMLAKRRVIQQKWQAVDNWEPFIVPLEPPWAISKRYAHLEKKHDSPLDRS
jgi:GT2 family glycosyltransferase